MEFEGDIGLIQRKVATVPEGHARRAAVFDSLDPQPGQTMLDIGCGGGHLVKTFALAVGGGGRAIGLDPSEEQLGSARELCADEPAAELIAGDATDMDLPDGLCDGVSSIQTLEYIDDVDRALSEIRRVLKPGGRIALVSVLWDLWRFHGADPELNQEMHEIWKGHCPHQMLPMEISSKLESAGFDGIEQKPLAFLNTAFDQGTYAYWASRAVAVFARANGMDAEKVDIWLDQLARAETEGRFGFASVPVMTNALAA